MGGTWICATLFGILGLAETSRLAGTGAQLDYEILANSLVQFIMFSAGTATAIALRGRIPAFSILWRSLFVFAGGACWFASAVGCNAKGIGVAPSGPTIPLGYALAAMGCVWIFLAFIGIRAQMPWTLIYLGRISFGLYMYHELAIQTVHEVLVELGHPLGYFSASPFTFMLTIVAAAVSFKYFETPFLRKKEELAAIDTRLGS